METLKIELDSDWALMFTELRHGTSRKVQAVYEPYLNKKEVQEILSKLNNGNTEELTKLQDIIGAIPSINATDVMILNQVKEWSFGDISQEVLDDMPERKRSILSAKCDELYTYPLAESGKRN